MSTNMPDPTIQWLPEWQIPMEEWIAFQMATADPGHGLDHVMRVVENAKRIGADEQANLDIVLPSAWMHDCVCVPKNSPDRAKASTLAADRANLFLQTLLVPESMRNAIHHCIQSHSFSAKIPCATIEAKVVQDADRLEALGAIGLSRCLMTGGAMGQRLYDPHQPFPIDRPTQDTVQSIDHFFAKLLGLHRTMQTENGQRIAKERTDFLVRYLEQLANELAISNQQLRTAIGKHI
jgi:uncharacterized protein